MAVKSFLYDKIKIHSLWKKKFLIIKRESLKNNIDLMLQGTKILVFCYWIEFSTDYTACDVFSNSSGGIEGNAIEYPCQFWYKKMIEELQHENYIIPVFSYKEAIKIQNSLRFSEYRLKKHEK